MATETLRPNAAGDECNITKESGAACPDHYQNVDEAVADDNTTHVGDNPTAYRRDLYALANSSGAGTINQIEVFGRFQHRTNIPTQEHAKICIKTGGTVFEQAYQLAAAGTWTDKSKVWATNPDTGNPWTWTEIDSLQVGCSVRRGVPASANRTDCTQLYVVITYTPAATEKSSSDSGSGSEGAFALTAALSGAENGQGQEAIGSQLAAITAVDAGTSVESGALLKDLFASELGQGRDSLAAKIETPTKGGGMKLWT